LVNLKGRILVAGPPT